MCSSAVPLVWVCAAGVRGVGSRHTARRSFALFYVTTCCFFNRFLPGLDRIAFSQCESTTHVHVYSFISPRTRARAAFSKGVSNPKASNLDVQLLRLRDSSQTTVRCSVSSSSLQLYDFYAKSDLSAKCRGLLAMSGMRRSCSKHRHGGQSVTRGAANECALREGRLAAADCGLGVWAGWGSQGARRDRKVG